MSDNRLQNCKKIGIMGGTFNPIHIGHLLMGRWAKDHAQLDAVIFIPAGNPYMKAGSQVLDGSHRLKMVQLSVEPCEDFYTSDIEIRREGYTYTYETLEELTKLYPNAEFYFIVGADSLYNFERWVHPELILKNCTLIAAARNGAAMEELEAKKTELENRFGGKIMLMDFPAFDVSSTMVRERVKEGKSIRYLAPDKVCDYIEENAFYLS